MLTELLLIAGAGFLGKKAIENPDKAKEIINRLADESAKKAMESGDPEKMEAAAKYYEQKTRKAEYEAIQQEKLAMRQELSEQFNDNDY